MSELEPVVGHDLAAALGQDALDRLGRATLAWA